MIGKLIEDKEALILISWLFPNLYYTGITDLNILSPKTRINTPLFLKYCIILVSKATA